MDVLEQEEAIVAVYSRLEIWYSGNITRTSRHQECGLYARQPVICIPLTLRHRQERLQWARQHVHWTRNQWRAVLSMDESMCSFESNSRRIFNLEPQSEIRFQIEIHHTSIKEMHTDQAVPVFGRGEGMSLGERTALHVFSRGNVNAHTYRDDILVAYGPIYAGTI
ncbi:transposable element Tcb2 transposase [Trichonephila clavipes]|nr:transposable element Tcb2 transposase [Trichonephila clavipes]